MDDLFISFELEKEEFTFLMEHVRKGGLNLHTQEYRGNTTLWFNRLWLKGTFKDKRYALGKVSATDAQGLL